MPRNVRWRLFPPTFFCYMGDSNSHTKTHIPNQVSYSWGLVKLNLADAWFGVSPFICRDGWALWSTPGGPPYLLLSFLGVLRWGFNGFFSGLGGWGATWVRTNLNSTYPNRNSGWVLVRIVRLGLEAPLTRPKRNNRHSWIQTWGNLWCTYSSIGVGCSWLNKFVHIQRQSCKLRETDSQLFRAFLN